MILIICRIFVESKYIAIRYFDFTSDPTLKPNMNPNIHLTNGNFTDEIYSIKYLVFVMLYLVVTSSILGGFM